MDKNKLGFLTFYKELDQQEIKLKEEYDKMVSFPITALSAIIAGVYFVTNKGGDTLFSRDIFSYFLFALLAGFLFCWIASSYYYVDFIHGYKKRVYRVFPKAEELSIYQDRLIEYLQVSSPNSPIEAEFERSFQNYILQTYIEQATHNAGLNEQRQISYHSFKKYLIICFYILIVISAFCLTKFISL